MPDDAELLRQYTENQSEAAFAELVRRRIDLVYSVALRQCGGDAHLARDAAQRVFVALARKARALAGVPAVSGWLYRSARFAASDLVRAERRRRGREQAAHAMHELNGEAARDADWEKFRPVLDEVLCELRERDHDAVMLRFFEDRPFGEIGRALGITEDAARMRVERALEKLEQALARRGVRSTTAALGLALANQAGVAAPTGLAASVTGAATTMLGAGLTAFMAKTSSTLVIAGLIAAGTGLAIYQARTNAALKHEVASLQVDRDRLIAQQTKELDAARKREAEVQTPPATRAGSEAGGAGGDTAARVAAALPLPPASEKNDPAMLAAAKEKLARIGNLRDSRIQEAPGFDETTIAAIRTWLKQDPAEVVRWLGTIDGTRKQREHTTEALIWLEIDDDPELAFLLAGSIGNEVVRRNRSRDVVRRWAARDRAAAVRAITAADLTSGERQSLLNMAELGARRP